MFHLTIPLIPVFLYVNCKSYITYVLYDLYYHKMLCFGIVFLFFIIKVQYIFCISYILYIILLFLSCILFIICCICHLYICLCYICIICYSIKYLLNTYFIYMLCAFCVLYILCIICTLLKI